MSIGKRILAFPFHDPEGILTPHLLRELPHLLATFDSIAVSATPATIEHNGACLDMLTSMGIHVRLQAPGSTIGDHQRGALAEALTHAHPMDMIHYLYIDRLLFALATNHREQCLADIKAAAHQWILWERTEEAWATHPTCYREIEQAANVFGRHLLGVEVELGSCGMSIRADVARKLLGSSSAPGMEAATEWILLGYHMGHRPEQRKVDWLAWEDPFILGVDQNTLKEEREKSRDEIHRRLAMNAPFTVLTGDSRFHR